MSVERVLDKQGEPINEGDFVRTRYRGGEHKGEVDRIVMDEKGAQEEGVANPPKVFPKRRAGLALTLLKGS
ncbi:hypothetical protein VTN49DRAFT_2053 [Thermomyces lanuginosus]|uniref:uncharacterized protein n=1 Tax=Thermomyces lanuginosus TaxID=5541 RepID=UPI00374230FA